MSTKLEGVEVIVIQDCSFNGPDHRSLGKLFMGDHVLTHECYVPHLLDAGLICMPEEFANLDKLAAQADLADIDAEIERMIAEQERLQLEAKEGGAEAEAAASFGEEEEEGEEEEGEEDAEPEAVAVAPKKPAAAKKPTQARRK